MTVQTPEGIDIFVLPDYAACGYTGISLLDMEECPVHRFGDLEGYCCPELCADYREEPTAYG